MPSRKPLAAALLAMFATPLAMPGWAADATPPVSQQPAAPTPPPAREKTLGEVKVIDDNSNDYAPGVSTIGAKVPTAIRDIPQSVTVVPRAVIDAQGAASLSDALRYVPGITIGGAEGGQIGTNINLRGFTARTDIFLDGMRDRGQYYRDTFFLDSVEVLKGPSSLLFGRGSTGGVINQVSKLPTLAPIREITGYVGTDDYYRLTGDLNAPISDTAAFRLNLMAQDISTTRDVMRNQDIGAAPSSRAGIGTPTEITLSAMVAHNHDMPDYGIAPLNGAPAPLKYSNFYGLTDDRTVQDVQVVSAKVEHKFNSNLTLRNQTGYNHYSIDAQETGATRTGTFVNNLFTPLTTAATGNQTDLPLSSLFVQLTSHDRKITDDSIDNQTDLIAKFDTGQVRNTLLAGMEIGRDTYGNQAYTRVDPTINGTAGLAVVALENPAYRAASANTVRTSGNNAQANADTLAFYANDTAELNRQWKLVGGVRWDRFNATVANSINSDNTPGNTTVPSAGQDVTFTSYRAGAIYQPNDAQSYYVAYGTSFDPSIETLALTTGQEDLASEKTRSYEVGAKWDAFQGNLSVTSALFQVEKTNARTQVSTGVYTLDGNIRVNGFELTAAGRLTSQWQIMGGYTYLDAKIVKASALDGTQGKVPANTPRNAVALWTTYNWTKEWEFGGGLTYMSSRYASNTDVVTAPGFTRFDATVAYHQPKYDIRLNWFNVGDKDYIAALIPSDGGRSIPGIGSTLLASLTYRF
jgi:catecholate siderophore receptor